MNRYVRHVSVALAMCVIFCMPATAADYDLVLSGGRVIDPETGLDGVRNVGITGNVIAIVTTDDISGAKVIDASGLVVSPGFIDLHAHGQSIDAARMQALDGVTTALELEAGVLPVAAYYDQLSKEGRPINYGASVSWSSARIATFLNIEPEISHEWSFKYFDDPTWQEKIATDTQLKDILAQLQDGLDEGGLGVGILVGYAPRSGRKEYYAVSELAAKNDVPTFTHARFLSVTEPDSSFEGMAEIITAAAGTGVHAHIVHMNSISLRDIDVIAKLIAGAQQRGLSITTEAYPYGAGSTSIGSAMFRGPGWRERIGGVTAHNFDVDGKRLTEEEFAHLQQEKPETQTVVHFLDTSVPDDKAKLDKSVLFPGGGIASDGGFWSVDGKIIPQDTWPIPDNAWSHPRSAGTFSHFLRQYVREKKVLSLLQAIAKISYGPAKTLEDAVPQMAKKGRLQAGMDADIVIFDPEIISDRATYEKPAQPSVGFQYVIVGGVQLVENGKLNTDVLPGRPIRNQSTP